MLKLKKIASVFLMLVVMVSASGVFMEDSFANSSTTKTGRVNYNDLREPSGLSAKDLESLLSHLPEIKGLGKSFAKAEKDYGVNAIFLMSLARHESGNGTSWLAENNNNLYGYKGKGAKGYRHFETKDECIQTVAKALKENYLTKGGKYFSGYDLKSVNSRYAEDPQWSTKVISVSRGMTKRTFD